jgi:hypothetical protein
MRADRLAMLLAALVALGGCSSDSGGPPHHEASRGLTTAGLNRSLAALQRIARQNGGTRAAGTPGFRASADYVAARLAHAGWTVTRQDVPFTFFRLKSASLSVGGRRLRAARDFQVLSYSGSGRARGPLRGVGLGCAEGDFKGLRAGELPLAQRGGNCFFHDKARNAERAGAKALLVVESVLSRRGVPSGTLGFPGIRIPVLVMSSRALGGGRRAALHVDAAMRAATTENVIAETPGGNGGHVVMAGGHLDSVRGGPGIEDNGTGVATLIGAAGAIGPNPPGAKLRFAFWAAEELGLLGSRHYVDSLDKQERQRISAYLNFDMVGSPNPVPQVYADGSPRLARALRRADGGRLGGASVGGASDHALFQAAGIPVNGLYTGSDEAGPGGKPRDPCYHLACDTIHNVDRPMLLRMARTATRALRALSAQAK